MFTSFEVWYAEIKINIEKHNLQCRRFECSIFFNLCIILTLIANLSNYLLINLKSWFSSINMFILSSLYKFILSFGLFYWFWRINFLIRSIRKCLLISNFLFSLFDSLSPVFFLLIGEDIVLKDIFNLIVFLWVFDIWVLVNNISWIFGCCFNIRPFLWRRFFWDILKMIFNRSSLIIFSTLKKSTVIIVSIELMLELLYDVFLSQRFYYARVEIHFGPKFNQLLFLFVKDHKVNILTAEAGQLNSLLKDTSLSLTVCHIPLVFVLNIFDIIDLFFPHFVIWNK